MKVALSQLAHARASWSEDGWTLAVIGWGEAEYAILARELTAQRLEVALGYSYSRPVQRFELLGVGALLFLWSGSWEEQRVSLRADAGGDALGSVVLRLEIEKGS